MGEKELLPEILMKHIEIGEKKALEHYDRKKREWSETTETIHRSWNEIENQIKAVLPEEIRDYFIVDQPPIYSLQEATNGYGNGLSQMLVDQLKEKIPEITLNDRKGYLDIPRLDRVYVKIILQDGEPIVLYRGPTEGYNEQDGSLELALYYAKISYDNDVRRRFDVIEIED